MPECGFQTVHGPAGFDSINERRDKFAGPLKRVPGKPTCTIFFGTAGGEHCLLESEDGEYVFRVAEAVDEELIAGG
jgi:hypothetical protein